MRSTFTRSTQQPARPAPGRRVAPVVALPTARNAMAIPAYSVGTTIPVTAPIQMMNGQPGGNDDDVEWGPFQGAAPPAHQGGQDDVEWGPFQGAGDQQGAAPNNPPPAPVVEEDWQPNFPPIADAAQQPVVPAQNPPAQHPVAQNPPPAPNHGPHVDTGQSHLSNGPMHTTGLANCTAIVAHNAQTGQARLYHWNTFNAMTPVPIDPDDDGDPNAPTMLQPLAEQFQQARAAVDAGVPEPRTYHIVPGGMWGPGGFTAQSTQNFHAGLAEHFPGATVHPGAHGTARWANGQLTGH